MLLVFFGDCLILNIRKLVDSGQCDLVEQRMSRPVGSFNIFDLRIMATLRHCISCMALYRKSKLVIGHHVLLLVPCLNIKYTTNTKKEEVFEFTKSHSALMHYK